MLDCDKSKVRTFNKDFKSKGSYHLTEKSRMEYVGLLMELYSCTEAATKIPRERLVDFKSRQNNQKTGAWEAHLTTAEG